MWFFVLFIALLQCNSVIGQNCLLLPSEKKHTDVDLYDGIPKSILKAFQNKEMEQNSKMEFYFIWGGRSIISYELILDKDENYQFKYYYGDSLCMEEVGKVNFNNKNHIGTNWQITCFPNYYNDQYQLLLIKLDTGILFIESQFGNIFETLNNHKEFFSLPVEAYLFCKSLLAFTPIKRQSKVKKKKD